MRPEASNTVINGAELDGVKTVGPGPPAPASPTAYPGPVMRNPVPPSDTGFPSELTTSPCTILGRSCGAPCGGSCRVTWLTRWEIQCRLEARDSSSPDRD